MHKFHFWKFFIKILAGFLNGLLGMFGLKLSRSGSTTINTLEFGPVFSRLQTKNIPLSTVIDVGASDGRWSQGLKAFFPNLRYHLIEANSFHKKGLKQFLLKNPKDSFTLAAAGDISGEIYFDSQDAWGGTASYQPGGETVSKVSCTTVDHEVSKHELRAPFLLKLDTHGFEIPIFEGATLTLAATNVIVVETYNFYLTSQSCTFWELCSYLQEKGFRPVDLLQPMHRPKDSVLWQVDMVFLRSDRPEFRDNCYN